MVLAQTLEALGQRQVSEVFILQTVAAAVAAVRLAVAALTGLPGLPVVVLVAAKQTELVVLVLLGSVQRAVILPLPVTQMLEPVAAVLVVSVVPQLAQMLERVAPVV